MAAVLAVLAIQQWWITSQQVATTPYSKCDEFRPSCRGSGQDYFLSGNCGYARLQTERDMR